MVSYINSGNKLRVSKPVTGGNVSRFVIIAWHVHVCFLPSLLLYIPQAY